MKEKIAITALRSISPLGDEPSQIWENYGRDSHFFAPMTFGGNTALVAPLPKDLKKGIAALKTSEPKYKTLDDSVLFAIYTARKAVSDAGWSPKDAFGVNIGSSRGATSLFERYHAAFLEKGHTPTLASPTTTLGNISSWVAHDLGTQGPDISHSITCSTALHSVLNGVAWLQSGMCQKFLVGGSEAPLTGFTVAQMRALKIYAEHPPEAGPAHHYPCRSLDLAKTKNTMILGEGAAMACLEPQGAAKALAHIVGVGYATEPLQHNVSLSTDAVCFQRAMKMALGKSSAEDVDAIVMHAPGTIKGDLSELGAINKVFGTKKPYMTGNKWKLGHTFGASGMLSLELALCMLQQQRAVPVPFVPEQGQPQRLERIMVNAVGFGGNAVSILLERA
ncbi:beta-ketoacyl synthase N-terminal-like domain-containing protein [Maribacter sp. 2307ULW6-5]|uniref:beta-ketoacyl synthase N-terminal-like domain-containing protein n=1 Tax=Maribacter sp. 2307ULW6-5 TaxID=3386275 RepID=UPI0039BD7168